MKLFVLFVSNEQIVRKLQRLMHCFSEPASSCQEVKRKEVHYRVMLTPEMQVDLKYDANRPYHLRICNHLRLCT